MLVYFSVILVVLLGFCGLAIDSERAELRTVQLQAAADDGALTLASEYARGNTGWATTAATEVTAFGALNGLTGLTTTVQHLASAGPYTTDGSTYEVLVKQSLPLTFLNLITKTGTTPVSARSVAMIPPCSYFMNTASTSLYMASAGMSTTCPVYVNTAVGIDGFATLNSLQTKVTGASSSSSVPGHANPALIYNAPTLPDPLAYVTAPVLSSCTISGGFATTTPVTVYPGTYCGGFTISNTTAFLYPGLYIITGGLQIHNSTISGTGVTLFFTKGGGAGYGTMRLDTGSTWNLSAPTDASGGGIPGVVIMNDRNWTGGATDFQFDTSTYRADGIIYLTNTGMTDSQTNMSAANYFGVVTKYMYQYNCNFYPSYNYSVLPGGNPFHIPSRLVQ